MSENLCFFLNILQMGPVYVFAEKLPETLIRGICQLGPNYAFSFDPPQVDSREVGLLPTRDPHLQALSELGSEDPGEATSQPTGTKPSGGLRQAEAVTGSATATLQQQNLHLEALSGTLAPLIILAYNPSVWGGEYFLDNTPEHNTVKWTNGPQASSVARHKAGRSKTEHDRLIYSMGGSQSHIFVHSRLTDNPREDSSYGRFARSLDGSRRLSSHRSDAPARSRGWSGGSGCWGEDGEEGENASCVQPRPRPGFMHAMRLPGTRECVMRDVRDALDCLGGVKVLLPLFAQFDHGVRRGEGLISYQTDPRLNETVLALLAGTLRDRYIYTRVSLYYRVVVFLDFMCVFFLF